MVEIIAINKIIIGMSQRLKANFNFEIFDIVTLSKNQQSNKTASGLFKKHFFVGEEAHTKDYAR